MVKWEGHRGHLARPRCAAPGPVRYITSHHRLGVSTLRPDKPASACPDPPPCSGPPATVPNSSSRSYSTRRRRHRGRRSAPLPSPIRRNPPLRPPPQTLSLFPSHPHAPVRRGSLFTPQIACDGIQGPGRRGRLLGRRLLLVVRRRHAHLGHRRAQIRQRVSLPDPWCPPSAAPLLRSALSYPVGALRELIGGDRDHYAP